MSKKAGSGRLQSQDLRLIVSLAVVCLIALGGAWFGLREYQNYFARVDTERQVNQWNTTVWGQFEDLERILTGRGASLADKALLQNAVKLTGMYRYKLYDAKGVVVAASRAKDIGTKTKDRDFYSKVTSGETVVRTSQKKLTEIDGYLEHLRRHPGDHPVDAAKQKFRSVTETYIPFVKKGKFLGAVETYVDTTDLTSARGALADYLKLGLLVLFVALFGVCGLFIVQNVRARNKDVKALADAHAKASAAEAEVRALNADLEKRVNDRTAELEQAAKEIVELNLELEKRVERSTEKLKTAEDELVRKNRLATLGQLTATVSHELRNPLGAVRTAAYLIDKKTRGKDLGVEKALARVENGIKRCDNIITELLDFTRAKELALQFQPFDAWLQAAVGEQPIPEQVKVNYDLNLGDTEVQYDPDRFRRVVINLISNASEAMVGDGNDPNFIPTFNPTITVHTGVTDQRVELSVSDNGPGVSKENLQKIFEPLFSTKSFGVGLGLPAVQQIMEQHGGGFEITSTEGAGATATVWFPLSAIKEKAA